MHQTPLLRRVVALGPVLVLALFGVTAVLCLHRLGNLYGAVEDGYRTEGTLRLLRTRLTDAETATRGYLLTRREEFLEPLRDVPEDVDSVLLALRAETRVPVPEDALGRLRGLSRERLAILEAAVARERRGGAIARDPAGQSGRGKVVMDSIRAEIRWLEVHAAGRIRRDSAAARRMEQATVAVLVAGLVLSAVLSMVASRLLSRYAAEQEDAARRAAESSEQLMQQALELELQASELQEHAVEAEHLRDEASAREARFRGMIEWASDLITVLSRDGTIEYQSPSALRVLGFTPAEMVGRSLFEFVHPDDVPDVRRRFAELETEGVTGPVLHYRARGGDQAWRYFESVATNLLHDPAVHGFVVNSRDVTERHSAEERLREKEMQLLQSQKMEAIGRLAGGIAHDFNNLLLIISGNLTLLRVSEEDQGILEGAQTAVGRAADLIRNLLSFSRRSPGDPQLVDLNAVVSRTEGMLRRVIGEDVLISTSLEANLPLIVADTVQVEQVIMNLAVNARDAMPEGGTLRIETLTWASGDRVALVVSDTGVGMEDHTRSRIFEPFFTTKEPGKGTGLGLSTVYGIVQQAGGEIRVDSRPGAGTRFTIIFPAVRERLAASEPNPQRTSGGTETLLVVEDEPGVRALVEIMLRRNGYTVLTASGMDEARSLARQHGDAISLLVTDVVMPGGSGPAVARAVRAICPGVRVLYISGYSGEALGGKVPEPGAMILEKPFGTQELLAAVRAALKGSGAAGESASPGSTG